MSLQLFIMVLFGALFFLLLIFRVVEPAYVLLFNKPIYIHWYAIAHKLSPSQKYILEQEFTFYQKLSIKRKRFFEHRVAVFIAKYDFVGK